MMGVISRLLIIIIYYNPMSDWDVHGANQKLAY